MLEGCNSANSVGSPSDYSTAKLGAANIYNDPLLGASLLLKGSSAVVGYTGVSNSVFHLPVDSGSLGKQFRLGDQVLAAKTQLPNEYNQPQKLELLGDPLLMVQAG